jgi:hypothetical protein
MAVTLNWLIISRNPECRCTLQYQKSAPKQLKSPSYHCQSSAFLELIRRKKLPPLKHPPRILVSEYLRVRQCHRRYSLLSWDHSRHTWTTPNLPQRSYHRPSHVSPWRTKKNQPLPLKNQCISHLQLSPSWKSTPKKPPTETPPTPDLSFKDSPKEQTPLRLPSSTISAVWPEKGDKWTISLLTLLPSTEMAPGKTHSTRRIQKKHKNGLMRKNSRQ